MKRKTKVLIIDYDVAARQQLETLIKSDAEASVLGALGDISKVFTLSYRKKLDLLFIEKGVLENSPPGILKEIKDLNDHLEIVITGNNDEFPELTERNEVMGFLQKSFTENDLRIHFNNLKLYKASMAVKSKRSKTQHFCLTHKKIRFDNRSNIMMIDPQHIIYVEADNCYSDIVLLNDKRETLSITLGEVERIVPSEIFFRISRTHIINLVYLNIVKRREKLCELIVNDKSLWFKISRNRIRSLEKAL